MRCLSRVLMDRPLLLLCLVICASTLTSCGYVPAEYGKSSPSPSPPPAACPITEDYSTTESSLRTYIFLGEDERAANILCTRQMFSQGWGLRYLPEQECAVVKTANRRSDPDIVAYRAIALSAKRCGGATRLANAIVVSYELSCRCSLFNSTERDRMRDAFRDILQDPIAIHEIISYGGSEDSKTPDRSPSMSPSPYMASSRGHGRRLEATESSPTDGFVCGHCEPPDKCNGVVFWCT